MGTSNLKSKVAKGAVWAMLEKFSMKVLSFVVTMVLARLLTPTDYGTVALLYIFTGIASTLADSGFGRALVQKKDATELDFNSVFYLSLGVSGIMYAVMFFSAPAIAAFYNVPELTNITRVVSLSLFFHAINGVQSAELNRKLLFNLSFRISVVSSVASAIVGITLAYMGFGPWALVWNSIASGVASTIAYWVVIAWRPKLMFSWQAVSGLFSFGWKMAVAGLLDTATSQLSGLMIGKFYTRADLAYVDKGRGIPAMGMDAINGTLTRVAFPALATLQDDPARLREAMRKMIQCSTFLVFPAMVGCAICAYDLVPLYFGNQWTASIVFCQIACFQFALWPFHTINLQAITAFGRSDIFLKLELIKKVVGLTILFASIRYGVIIFVIVSAFIGSPLSLLINSWPNRRLFGYTIGMQLRDVVPTVLASVAMGVVVWLVGYCGVKIGIGVWRLAVQIPAGILVFGLISVWFKLTPAGEYLKMLDMSIGKRFPIVSTFARRFE